MESRVIARRKTSKVAFSKTGEDGDVENSSCRVGGGCGFCAVAEVVFLVEWGVDFGHPPIIDARAQQSFFSVRGAHLPARQSV